MNFLKNKDVTTGYRFHGQRARHLYSRIIVELKILVKDLNLWQNFF